jgi:hypothetical protein
MNLTKNMIIVDTGFLITRQEPGNASLEDLPLMCVNYHSSTEPTILDYSGFLSW